MFTLFIDLWRWCIFFCVRIIHRLTQNDYVAGISSVLFTLFIGKSICSCFLYVAEISFVLFTLFTGCPIYSYDDDISLVVLTFA